ncbi:MAG: hypothetical protein AAB408_01840, partial [Patescibacteria group bacterium]
MKKFTKIAVLNLLCAGILMLLLPTHWFPSFYDVRYVGYASFLGAFLILFLPAMIRVAQYVPNAHKKNQAVDSFEFFISFT